MLGCAFRGIANKGLALIGEGGGWGGYCDPTHCMCNEV